MAAIFIATDYLLKRLRRKYQPSRAKHGSKSPDSLVRSRSSWPIRYREKWEYRNCELSMIMNRVVSCETGNCCVARHVCRNDCFNDRLLIFPLWISLICNTSSGSRVLILRLYSRGKASQKKPRCRANTIKRTPGSLAEEPIWKSCWLIYVDRLWTFRERTLTWLRENKKSVKIIWLSLQTCYRLTNKFAKFCALSLN